MHGIRRLDPSTITAEQRAEKAAKIQRYKQVKEAAMDMRAKGVYDQRALEIVAKLLEINPEFYTLWNYRREILQSLLKASDEDSSRRLLDDELQVVERAIRRNPKSYVTWFHRLWVVRLGYADLENEIGLTTDFLRLDNRNFHCWDYRRALVKLANVAAQDELDFTSDKIKEDFSNYSAWHYRSKLLWSMGFDDERVEAELELVADAVYTEPDDQSAWLYHNWLCFHREQPRERLQQQLVMIDELLQLEPDCKWAILTKVRLQHALRVGPVEDERNRSYRRLIELDGKRRRYYDAFFASLSLPASSS